MIGITENLKKYIQVVKNETGLEVGLCFFGDIFIDYYENPTVSCK